MSFSRMTVLLALSGCLFRPDVRDERIAELTACVDEVDGTLWYLDSDGDGYGQADQEVLQRCDQPDGYAASSGDCNDNAPGISPKADEVCDGVDNNCDGVPDEDTAIDALGWYPDLDLDGFGDQSAERFSCERPEGGDDLINLGGDCDDDNDRIHPEADEFCDEIDNNCDGEVDEDTAVDAPDWYPDLDGDGFADNDAPLPSCDQPPGYYDSGPWDCDDTDPGVHPLAIDTLLVDRNCDGQEPGLGQADGKVWGALSGDEAGHAISGGSDVDGDGLPDLIIGAPNDDNGGSNAGAVYVLPGRAGQPAPRDGLPNVAIRLTGATDGDAAGYGVSSSGDVNGDGVDDVLIGARGYLTDRGAAYLVPGDPNGFAGFGLGNQTRLTGEFDGDLAGTAVAILGDQNGDGFDEIVVGAPYNDNNGSSAGAVYLVYGSSNPGSIGLGSASWELLGVPFGHAGEVVADVGDLNGDGVADLGVGASEANDSGASSGTAYVILAGGTPATQLASADIVLFGEAGGDLAGYALSSAGDLNGDGYDDLVVGAPNHDDPSTRAGAAYILLGPVSPGVSSLVQADSKWVGESNDYQAGSSVASAGDVNGDGTEDLVIGSFGYGNTSGTAYLVLGQPILPSYERLNQAQARLNAENNADRVGDAVSGLGDYNGDGYADFAVSAPLEDTGGGNAGAVYLIHGYAF